MSSFAWFPVLGILYGAFAIWCVLSVVRYELRTSGVMSWKLLAVVLVLASVWPLVLIVGGLLEYSTEPR